MHVITDPPEQTIKVKTTSALISMKESQRYARHEDDHPTVTIKLFNINNPHKMPGEFPHTVYEFTNTEKVRIRRLNVSFYLEGSDIVVNDLEELYIIRKDHKIILKGYQYELEERVPEHKPSA